MTHVYSQFKPLYLLILVDVDDIITTSNNTLAITKLITELNSNFFLKYLGELSYFLGVEVERSGDHIFLSQNKYIKDLLLNVKMEGAKPSSSATLTGKQISVRYGDPFDNPAAYTQLEPCNILLWLYHRLL